MQSAVEWPQLITALYQHIFPGREVPFDFTEQPLSAHATQEEINLASLTQLLSYPPEGPAYSYVQQLLDVRQRQGHYGSHTVSLPSSTSQSSRDIIGLKWLLCTCLGVVFCRERHTLIDAGCLQAKSHQGQRRPSRPR